MNKTVATSIFAATLGLTLLAGAPANAYPRGGEMPGTVCTPWVDAEGFDRTDCVQAPAKTDELQPTAPATDVVDDTPAPDNVDGKPAEDAPPFQTPAPEVPTEEPTEETPAPIESPAPEVPADNEIPADEQPPVEEAPVVNEPQEDEPGWDCATQGNKQCGPIELETPVVEVKPEAPVAAGIDVKASIETPAAAPVQVQQASASNGELAQTGAADWALPLGVGGVALAGGIAVMALNRRRTATK